MDLKNTIELIGIPGLMLAMFMVGSSPLGAIVPGDSLLVIAGVFAGQGILNFSFMLVFFPFFVFAGDVVGYMFGQLLGPEIFERNNKLFRKSGLMKARKYMDTKGFKLLVYIKFIPVIRTFLPPVIGALNMNKMTYFSVSLISSIFWIWILLSLGYILGNSVSNMRQLLIPILFLLAGMSLLHPAFNLIKTHRRKKSRS